MSFKLLKQLFRPAVDNLDPSALFDLLALYLLNQFVVCHKLGLFPYVFIAFLLSMLGPLHGLGSWLVIRFVLLLLL